MVGRWRGLLPSLRGMGGGASWYRHLVGSVVAVVELPYCCIVCRGLGHVGIYDDGE